MQITRGRQFLHPVSLRRVTPAWRGSLRGTGFHGGGPAGGGGRVRARRFRAQLEQTITAGLIGRGAAACAREIAIDRAILAVTSSTRLKGRGWSRVDPASAGKPPSDFPLGRTIRTVRRESATRIHARAMRGRIHPVG